MARGSRKESQDGRGIVTDSAGAGSFAPAHSAPLPSSAPGVPALGRSRGGSAPSSGRAGGRGGRGQVGRGTRSRSNPIPGGAATPSRARGRGSSVGAKPTSAPVETKPAELSTNVTGMRFMQSVQEDAQRKKVEQEQRRREAAISEAVKRPSEGAAPPVLMFGRRSYKGFNPVVEQWMKDQRKKHAAAVAAAEEFEQAARLRNMKQRRIGH
eukprot:CAMPEP_0194541170 /NCGR_PEP_ID=MMETSP0253-20130528/81760_1 /TAXON_ID=2966 /ORGANISM="Noctiluca scintillans" /LENGTH=210 /DNA_ID=CAMNT_0039387633 /DNA_START=18 /DNA_END=650 /DNA_ORIENTATION=-